MFKSIEAKAETGRLWAANKGVYPGSLTEQSLHLFKLLVENEPLNLTYLNPTSHSHH